MPMFWNVEVGQGYGHVTGHWGKRRRPALFNHWKWIWRRRGAEKVSRGVTGDSHGQGKMPGHAYGLGQGQEGGKHT